MQDGHSFRYGIINLGGRDRAEVLAKFEAVRADLGVSFLPLNAVEPEAETMPAAELVPGVPSAEALRPGSPSVTA